MSSEKTVDVKQNDKLSEICLEDGGKCGVGGFCIECHLIDQNANLTKNSKSKET